MGSVQKAGLNQVMRRAVEQTGADPGRKSCFSKELRLSVAEKSDRDLVGCLHAACVLEASARKPGNVHPGASFADASYQDFRRAAEVAAPVLARAGELGVGPAVRQAVAATRAVVPGNPNLGIILLLAPLAAVPAEQPLAMGIDDVLARLTVADSCEVYAAIRMARPAGLGQVTEQDIAGVPTVTLREAMALAADRDLVARQYACGFADVLEFGVPVLAQHSPRSLDGRGVGGEGGPGFEHQWEQAVIHLHLEFLARHPDSLIARKCGPAVAAEASRRATEVLRSGWPHDPATAAALDDFDRWLRANGNRRNPGTTADLVAATLFAALRDRHVTRPDRTAVGLGSVSNCDANAYP
jgi:triphosphoribosyl-dephospho-CoA synthase